MGLAHWTIFADNDSHKEELFARLLNTSDPPKGFKELQGLCGGLLSPSEIDRYIEEEARHDLHILTRDKKQALQTMSSGERKKALLNHLLQQSHDFLVLDNPLDNLDTASRKAVFDLVGQISENTHIIQLVNRREDMFPLASAFYVLTKDVLSPLEDPDQRFNLQPPPFSKNNVPRALEDVQLDSSILVRFREVSISYGEKAVLNKISWDLKPGEYWQLSGPNGSGKTTLLSLISGENPKAYGQDITLFGIKKGSGESVWELKEKLGYFTPAMTDRFRGYHSLENMLISGLHDSIGLYINPTPAEKRLAREWLAFLGMEELGNQYFHELSKGQQRLIMCVRAMIKHPPLLILDEPTTGLDDYNAAQLVHLVNKMAADSHCCIVFVSHRNEPGLNPLYTLYLEPGEGGSKGAVVPNPH